MSEEFVEGEVMGGSGVADAIAAGMALTAVTDRIYKDEATGKTFYKDNNGHLAEVKAVRTKACPLEEDTVTIRGVDHFVNYLETIDLSSAAIFYSAGKFSCILDYFDGPANGEGLKNKSVYLILQTSEALMHWQQRDRTNLDQEVLANHIEDRLEDVIAPSGADMLDIVNNFHATSEVHFSKVQNLGNGQVQFTYAEDLEAAAGSDKKMTIPESFELALPLYDNVVGDTYEHELVRVKARFRYRVKRQELSMQYILESTEDAFKEEVSSIFNHLQAKLGLKIFVGRG